MKIVKSVGERLLPYLPRTEMRLVLAFTGIGQSLAAGSRALVRHGWDALGEHLTTLERLGTLAFTAHVSVYGCVRAPQLAKFAIPAAVVAWCVAAWWIAPPESVEPAPEDEPGDASNEPPEDPTDSFTTWLLQLIGNAPGIHLRELYPAMRQLPGHEGRSDPELRAALKALDIPVTRSLRLPHAAGRSGVARADVLALPSSSGEPSGENGGDAGQSVDSPPVSGSGEQLESA